MDGNLSKGVMSDGRLLVSCWSLDDSGRHSGPATHRTGARLRLTSYNLCIVHSAMQ